MVNGWLIPKNRDRQCIRQSRQLSGAPVLATLIFNSLCRSATVNAPVLKGRDQMPLASVVSGKCIKKSIANDKLQIAKNFKTMRNSKNEDE